MTNRIFENTNNRVVFPTNISLEDRNRIRTVVYYGRVSSEHEAQLSALANQMQWYDDQTKYHPNWKVLRKYIDYLPFKVTPLYRQTLNTRGANRGFTPEDPLFTLTVAADTAKRYCKRLGIKFFPTRYKPLTMVVYIT